MILWSFHSQIGQQGAYFFGLKSGDRFDVKPNLKGPKQVEFNDRHRTAPELILAAASEHHPKLVTILLRSFCRIIAVIMQHIHRATLMNSHKHIKEQPIDYQAYLVRLWRDGSDGEWRASAESVATGLIVNFACLSTLFAFLDAQTRNYQPKQYDADLQPPRG